MPAAERARSVLCTAAGGNTCPVCCFARSFKVPSGVFQAYGSYWPEGYIAHLAFASAFMCKYSASYCSDASSW